jgi:hypothetical protein
VIEVLCAEDRRINVPNWSAIPGGPVATERMQAFRSVLAGLQQQIDVDG